MKYLAILAILFLASCKTTDIIKRNIESIGKVKILSVFKVQRIEAEDVEEEIEVELEPTLETE